MIQVKISKYMKPNRKKGILLYFTAKYNNKNKINILK